MPVSYTHLEIYLELGAEGHSFEPIIAYGDNAAAVSYTHLDVYKRQEPVQNRSVKIGQSGS